MIRRRLLDELEGLDPAALLEVKRLLQASSRDKNDPDAVNLRESYGTPNFIFLGVLLSKMGSTSRKVRKWCSAATIRQDCFKRDQTQIIVFLVCSS